MKLSELLVVREHLKQLDLVSHYDTDQVLIDRLRVMLDEAPPVDQTMMQKIESLVNQKNNAVIELNTYLTGYLDRSIVDHHAPYKQESHNWAQHIDTYGYNEWLDYKDAIYGDETNAKLLEYASNRVKSYSSWQHPVLIYHLDTADYMNELFGFYPVYIVDKWKEIQHDLEERYNQAQVRKIRLYDLDRVMHLPQKCMGFAISRNHFTHCNTEQVEQEIQWMLQYMQPGSVICFNINDCEYNKCAELFERGIRSFQLGTELKAMIQGLGLEVLEWKYLEEPATVWVEVKVPGKLKSIKRAETLGIITSKGNID